MADTSLKFGTSGLRGLVSELNGRPAYAYSLAFAQMLIARGAAGRDGQVFVGHDLRASSPAIAGLCVAALTDAGLTAVECGPLPTPALAAHAMHEHAPSIMVTGSHIPDDRNGLKFYLPTGEIGKADEADIAQRHAQLGADLASRQAPVTEAADTRALAFYVSRYLDHFAPDTLEGLTIGVYQHSSVARDVLVDILSPLGAKTIALGRSDRFIPVDTEALRPEDRALLKGWASEHKLDAIVSTDGDADRPLIADENGAFIRGDLVGALTARHLGAYSIVTPVTSNSALEACGLFDRVVRTKVGSPYVIEGLGKAERDSGRIVVGFEANGGVLLGSTVDGFEDRASLGALPTRDAVLPIVSCLAEIRRHGRPLSEIAAEIGFLPAASDRLTDAPSEQSSSFLKRLAEDNAFAQASFAELGGAARFDTSDGVRIFAANGEVVHFRASGNAPELRCYVETRDAEQAATRLSWGLELAKRNLGSIRA